MAGKRSYEDGCGIAHALDLVGERWALLVVRELLLGSKRFTDLRVGLPGVSANILSQRLRELEQAGVVQRRKLPPPAGSWVYELTDWGRELEQVIIQLGRWGTGSSSLPRDAEIGVDSMILSLRVRFDPDAARDLRAEYELRLGEYRFRAVIADGRIDLTRGGAERADAIIEVTPRQLDSMISGDRPVAELVNAGGARVDGDMVAAERFATLFTP